MTKPTTKSPAERRLRKDIRALLQDYAKDTSTKNTDHVVREFLALIDDEVRRTRMSLPFHVEYEDSRRKIMTALAADRIHKREMLQDQQV